MTCRKVRKLIPLIAGDDLRPRLARAVRAHIDACPGCRAELEGFRAALAEAKAAARAESVPEWGGGEWNALMARVAAEAKGTGKSAGRRRHACPEAELGRGFGPRRRDRAGRSLRPFKRPVAAAGGAPGGSGLVIASENPRQDRVSITMVSPETGLQVVWFLDKNFDYKGEQE